MMPQPQDDSGEIPSLPSLNALRTFDAAARFESASRAADALHVTHGAVSRQIRQLEDQLGTPLFERAGRGLRLTAQGQELAAATRHHLGGLSRVCRELARGDAAAPFVLSCPGSFLARWFIPRMARLKEALPDLDLHLSAGDDIGGLRPGVDGMLRFQPPPFEGDGMEQIRVLGPERIGPILRPDRLPPGIASDLAAGKQVAPQALVGLSLLHTRSRPSAWADWCRQCGVASGRLSMGQGFDHLSYLLEATLVGLGVGIAPDYLVEEDLRSGRLVAPWGFVATDACLTLAVPRGPRSPRHPLADALADWLATELAQAPE
ncbi:LysR family transcriptional regulator [Halomonas sp. V046]|uniref:LysR family transcriptional regulator n=1 Tax=Halomonas sp. V046 TaxID=3459611 RepID=UPI004044537B